MVVNAIAPWEGKLVWVGTPNGGLNQNNEEWKSVEFVLTYTDGKLQERQIIFSAFGVERVNRILSTPIGTLLRVTFQPTAREYNGKWYGKNDVFGISVIQPQTTQAPPQGYAPQPQYPPQYGTQMPQQAPAYPAPPQQVYQQPAPQQFAPPASAAYRELTRPEQEEDLPI